MREVAFGKGAANPESWSRLKSVMHVGVGLLLALMLSACGHSSADGDATDTNASVVSSAAGATDGGGDTELQENQAPSLEESPAFAASDQLLAADIAQPSAKPGASVSLADSEPLSLQAGVADVFNVELKTPVTQGRMHVNITAKAPLNLMSELDEFDFDLSPDASYLLPITLMADEDGRYYLSLQIELTEGDQVSSRSLDVVVQVGSPVKTQINGMEKPEPGEDALVEMPAQESH